VFGQLGHLPKVGDEVTFAGGRARVLAMDKRRVARVALQLENGDDRDNGTAAH
jgi:CBS domain containing-hemolysin-like protein